MGSDSVLKRKPASGSFDRRLLLEALERRRLLSASPITTLDVTGLTDAIHAMARLPNGQILAAGYGQVDTADGLQEAGILVRFNADLSLDASFGVGGKLVSTAFSPGIDFEVLDDGSVLVLNQHHNGHPRSLDFSVAKITPDGQLDTSFGENGVASVDFNPNPDPNAGFNHYNDRPTDLAVDAQGRIVIVGSSDTPMFRAEQPATESDQISYRSWFDRIKLFSIARLTADGQLDTTFGENGRVTIDPAENAEWSGLTDVSIAPDGSILALGSYRTDDTRYSNPFDGVASTVVARFTDAGTLDSAFGTGGIKTLFQTDPMSPDETAALIQATKVSASNDAPEGGVFVYSYLSTTTPRETVAAKTMLPDGRTVLLVVNNVTGTAELRRYNVDGSVDAGFNPSVPANFGTGTIEVSPGNFVSFGRAVTMRADEMGIHITSSRTGSDAWTVVELGTDTPIGPTHLDYVTIDDQGNVSSQGSAALELPGRQHSAEHVLFEADGSLIVGGSFTETPWGPYDQASGSNPQDGTFDLYLKRVRPESSVAEPADVPQAPAAGEADVAAETPEPQVAPAPAEAIAPESSPAPASIAKDVLASVTDALGEEATESVAGA